MSPLPTVEAAPTIAPASPQIGTQRQRLVSLDVFRGITIAAMILVNDPGNWSAVYPPLLHAEWNGWTPTDLVFPFFLFIMGVAMEFSFASRQTDQAPSDPLRKSIVVHVFYR